MKIAVAVFLLFLWKYSVGENGTITIHIQPVFNGNKLVMDKWYFYGNDSIRFETIRFYLSGLKLINKGKIVDTMDKENVLIDIEKNANPIIQFVRHNDAAWEKIRLGIGIDSVTNVSGAMGGDLDPVNGMYWTWQSGYINVKMEGTASQSGGPDKSFQWHLGGYQFPDNTFRVVELNADDASKIDIQIDLTSFVSPTNLQKNYSIMSPSKSAVKLSDEFSKTFSLIK